MNKLFLCLLFLSSLVFEKVKADELDFDTNHLCILDSDEHLENDVIKILYKKGWLVRDLHSGYIRTGFQDIARRYRSSTNVEEIRTAQATIHSKQELEGNPILIWENQRGYYKSLLVGVFKKAITLSIYYTDQTEIITKTKKNNLATRTSTLNGGIKISMSRALNSFAKAMPLCNLSDFKQ